jgi:hypothetical protein
LGESGRAALRGGGAGDGVGEGGWGGVGAGGVGEKDRRGHRREKKICQRTNELKVPNGASGPEISDTPNRWSWTI